jgi:hypothetical protein
MPPNEAQTHFELVDPCLIDQRGWPRPRIRVEVTAAAADTAATGLQRSLGERLAALDNLAAAVLLEAFAGRSWNNMASTAPTTAQDACPKPLRTKSRAIDCEVSHGYSLIASGRDATRLMRGLRNPP